MSLTPSQRWLRRCSGCFRFIAAVYKADGDRILAAPDKDLKGARREDDISSSSGGQLRLRCCPPVAHRRKDRLLAAYFCGPVAAILLRPPKWLSDFDQAFYLTIAYDLNHHGVFSNGLFDDVNSTVAVPPPGRFFGPLYPWLVVAATKLDPRFAAAVSCTVEANHKMREGAECEVYARPMHIMHAALLALGVLAIAAAAEIIFTGSAVFWLAGDSCDDRARSGCRAVLVSS